MDDFTYVYLKDRVDGLIRQVKSNTGDESLSLIVQLSQLQKQVNKTFGDNEEFTKLDNLVKKYDIRKTLAKKGNLRVETEIADHSDIASKLQNLSNEEKHHLLQTKYGSIIKTYEQLKELKTVYKGSHLNVFEGNLDLLSGFEDSRGKIAGVETKVDSIGRCYQAILIKNMIVLEKYLHLVADELEYKVSVSERLENIDRTIREKEHESHEFSKF